MRTTGGPGPGWYQDPAGQQRWWDGVQWGPTLGPPAAPTPEEESGRALALVSWLGFFVVYGLVALVVRIVESDGNRFARWHAAEALNFQLTVLVIWNAAFVPLWVWLILTAPSSSEAPPAAFFALMALVMVVMMGSLVVVVLGAVRAGQGVWWRCPVVIPFLRRHRRERREQLAVEA